MTNGRQHHGRGRRYLLKVGVPSDAEFGKPIEDAEAFAGTLERLGSARDPTRRQIAEAMSDYRHHSKATSTDYSLNPLQRALNRELKESTPACCRCLEFQAVGSLERYPGIPLCGGCATEVQDILLAGPVYDKRADKFFYWLASGIVGREKRPAKGGLKSGVKWRPSVNALELIEIFVRQQGLCFLTGWELAAATSSGALQATPARLDAGRRHSRRNTVLVCQSIAQRLGKMSVAEFQALCGAVTAHSRTGAENELLNELA